ncbi:MAG TPA: hypothetical protein VFS19_06785 [Planctomycetota bacterium]|nr:hypothetical protein [Planctomycetota bacterium]
MRRFAVLLAVSLSAGLASAQDPAADDRTPIPATIESWYVITQNKEQIGWFHERINTTTMRNYRYDYTVESDYQYEITSAAGELSVFQISETLKAQLEEDFDIHDLDYRQITSGAQLDIKLKTYPESEERVATFELRTDPPVTREYKFLTSDTIHLYLNPMIYRLRQTGSLAQPTRLRERALHSTPEDPISVSYTAGALATKEFLGKQVKVSEVRIEGWDRGALIPFSHIWVDKYGRIVEAETADRMIVMTMVKDKEAAQGKRKGIIIGGRKDPFSKGDALERIVTGPRPDRPGGQTGPRQIDKKIPPDKFDATLAESRALVTKLQDEIARGLIEEARGTYLQILANYKGLYPLAEADHVKRTEVEKLKEDAEKHYGGVKRLMQQIVAKVDRINDLYQNENLEAIDREIVELEAMRNAPEFFRSEDGIQELDKGLRAAKEKRQQTVHRRELGTKTLVLTGTMTATEVVQEVVKLDLMVAGARIAVSQPVSVRRVVTWAVINDDAYREGETIQREGVKVQKILRHAVEVEYKNEVRQVVLRKS